MRIPLWILTVPAYPADAQVPNPKIDVAIVAARAIRADLSPNTVDVEPSGDPMLAEAVRSALGARLVRRESAVSCEAGQRRCRLREGSALLRVTDAVVQPRDAKVTIEVWWHTKTRPNHLSFRRMLIWLEPAGGTWTVTRKEVLLVT
jgi:hypothetical protein